MDIIDTNVLEPKKKSWFFSFLWKFILAILLIGSGLFYWSFYYPYSKGDRDGLLIKLSYRGNIFKTYEGEMLTGGISGNGIGIATEKFYFSVIDNSVADSLNKLQGQRIVVHYVQYNNKIFWRGDSEYIIEKIVSVNH